MTMDWYRKTLERDMVGLRVRTLRRIRNGRLDIAEGAVLEIAGKGGSALTLKAEACPSCGIAPFITRVHPSDVEVLA